MLRRWGAAALAAGCLNLAACGDDGEAAGDFETTTTEAAEESTTTTTAGETTTTAAEAERPTLATTGEDLVGVFASLQAYKSTLFTDPDPALLGEVVVAGTPYYDELNERITTLADNGYRIEMADTVYSDVQVSTRPDPNAALLSTVETTLPGIALLDASGQTVDSSPDREPVRVVFTLRRDADGRWRLEASQVLGPAG